MKKVGMNPGSTLIILMFSTLCLAIFALLSLSSASAGKAITDNASRMVTGYYEADTLAECVLAEIQEAGETVRGIQTFALENDTVMFSCYISDTKELYVEVVIAGGFEGVDIRKWQMRDTTTWEAETGIPVWLGD